MPLEPTICVRTPRSKLRRMLRWRTILPVPPQFVQSSVFAPSQVGQTRLPVPQVHSTSPLTQSGQGTVRPFVAGSVSTGLGIGTPESRIPSNRLETFSVTELVRLSACFWKNGFFFA